MNTQRLFAFAALAFTAACAGGTDSPVAPKDEAPVALATSTNPFFSVSMTPSSAFFQTPNAYQVPSAPQKVVIRSAYAAFATLGPPRITKIEYVGAPSGWLSGSIQMKSAYQADLDLRVMMGLPLGAYQAKVTFTLAGAVYYTVPVTFVSGVYFLDYANTGTGWTFSGLWHVAAGNNCANFRGCTPAPYEGSGFLWYASEATGNFNVPANIANSGSATSPAFALPAGAINPMVKVKTFFEIEYDVSPFSYDFMEFYLDEVGGAGASIFLGRINGSGGFNGGTSFTAPGGPWLSFTASVPSSAFGKTWKLRLFFTTRDGAYNDYRGWGVDEIIVIEGGSINTNLVAARARTGASQPEPGRTFTLAPPVEVPLIKRK